MMKRIIRRLIIVLFIISVPLVYAEETTTTAKLDCSSSQKSEARKKARNVTAAYEIKQRDDGTYYNEIVIYNIVDGLYIEYYTTQSDGRNKFSTYAGDTVQIYDFDVEDGTYVIEDNDIFTIKKYYFVVRDSEFNCSTDLRKFSITKPKYNRFSEIDECSYYSVQDLSYCQEWITSDIRISEFDIRDKINKILEDERKKLTTQCINCDGNIRNIEQYNRLVKLRQYLIIGLSIGIVVDIVTIIILIRKLREDRIWLK